MTYSSSPPSGNQQNVTASDLVRHFGIWQERAARAPVYVMHRGRPRLVLTSVDIMEALCAPHAVPRSGDDLALGVLLDTIADLTIIVAPDLTITAANAAARQQFGASMAPGAAIAAVSLAGGDFLRDAIQRVLESGLAEAVEIVPQRYPARRLACEIVAFPGGCLITARDLTAAQALLDARATRLAVAASLDATGVAATARIGLRGYLAESAPALARMLGVALDALAGTRFVTLADIASRVALGDAIEAVIESSDAHAIDASLLVRGASPLAVRIGLAPIGRAARVEAVQATIVRYATA